MNFRSKYILNVDMKLQEIFDPTANVWLMHHGRHCIVGETEDSLVRPVGEKRENSSLETKKTMKWLFKVPLSSCVSCLGSNLTQGAVQRTCKYFRMVTFSNELRK